MKIGWKVLVASLCGLLVSPAMAWEVDKIYDASSGLAPEVANGPYLGFGLEGGGTVTRNYVADLDGSPAWLDNLDAGKAKYRTDDTWGALNASEDLGLVWNMQMLSGTDGYPSNSDGRPEIVVKYGYELKFGYSAYGDRWFLGDGDMVRTEGGVDFSGIGGGWELPMPRGEWHTVRVQTTPDTGQMLWEIWVDELTDDAHHMAGYTTNTTTSSYLQWGVTSSDKVAAFATNSFYWSQGEGISPIPEPGALALLSLGGLALLRRRR